MPTHTDVRTARVTLARGANGSRCRLDLAAGLVSPRVVRHDAAGAQVALVATTASLLGGDHLRLVVEVGGGLRLDLHDVAGTVAYHGRGAGARLDVDVRVHPGATLCWSGEPLVVTDGAQVVRTLTVDVADGGRLLLRDRVALGRAGQEGGRLDCHTTMAYAGRPALVEDVAVRAGLGPGALGDARVVDTVTALGWRPGPVPGRPAYQLHEPGAVSRELVREAHHSTIPSVWEAWRSQLVVAPAPTNLTDLGGPSPA